MHDISIKYFVFYLMATNMFHDSSAIVYIGIISQLTGVAMPRFARRNASIQRIGCDLGALTKRRSADSIGFRHRELNKLVGYGCFSGFQTWDSNRLCTFRFHSQCFPIFITGDLCFFLSGNQRFCWWWSTKLLVEPCKTTILFVGEIIHFPTCFGKSRLIPFLGGDSHSSKSSAQNVALQGLRWFSKPRLQRCLRNRLKPQVRAVKGWMRFEQWLRSTLVDWWLVDICCGMGMEI